MRNRLRSPRTITIRSPAHSPFRKPNCPPRTRTWNLLNQSQACIQLHRRAFAWRSRFPSGAGRIRTAKAFRPLVYSQPGSPMPRLPHAVSERLSISKRKAEDSNPKRCRSTRFRDGGRAHRRRHLPSNTPSGNRTRSSGLRGRRLTIRLTGHRSSTHKRKAVVTIHKPRGLHPVSGRSGGRSAVHLPSTDRGGNRTRMDGVAVRRLATRPPGQCKERIDAPQEPRSA